MINGLLTQLTFAVYGFNEFSGPSWNTSSPCPNAIAVNPDRNSYCLEQPEGPYCHFPNMTLAHSALTHCANVDTLDVWFDYPNCVGVERDRSDFPFLEGEKYPPLRSLKLDGYSFGGLYVPPEREEKEMGLCMGPVREHDPWDARESWWQGEEWVKSKNNELQAEWEQLGATPKSNLDMWLEAMDWSQLEELSINTARSEMVDVINKLPQQLTSLKTLHIDSLPFITRLRNHSLETLKWVGPTQSDHLETILAHQGQSLKHLEYRCDELECQFWPTHTNTTLLPLLAPSLQHLSINLPRLQNGTWPLASLTPLAQLPSLKSLDLYFRMRAPCIAIKHFLGFTHSNCGTAYRAYETCYGKDSFETPLLNAEAAAYMFNFLRSENRAQNLETVTFRTGDWAPPISWGPGAPLGVGRRSASYCRVEAGREICHAVNEDYRQAWVEGEWEWDGDAWVKGVDFEELEWAEEQGETEKAGRLREKMKERIREIQGM